MGLTHFDLFLVAFSANFSCVNLVFTEISVSYGATLTNILLKFEGNPIGNTGWIELNKVLQYRSTKLVMIVSNGVFGEVACSLQHK